MITIKNQIKTESKFYPLFDVFQAHCPYCSYPNTIGDEADVCSHFITIDTAEKFVFAKTTSEGLE